MKREDLTLKQELFAREYIKDFNATRAAIEAGYSKKTAGQASSRMLKIVKIREFVKKLTVKRMDEVEIDAEWVLRELKALNDVSLSDFAIIDKDTGEFEFDLSKATKSQLSALSTLQIDSSHDPVFGKKVKMKLGLNDKIKVLEAIGRHVNVNAFKESLNVNAEIKIYIDKEDENA